MKKAVISLSGGMDSTSLLLNLLANEYEVFALSFNYGQKHSVELQRVKQNLEYMRGKGFTIHHDVVDISTVGKLFNSALTSDDVDVPEGAYDEEKMKATVVPNRNAIFSSINYGYALSLSTKHDEDVILCLGVHSGDHAIYPDCRPEFYDEIMKVFKMGNWNSEKVSLYLPYLYGNKFTILQDALASSGLIGLDFDTVLSNTNTCYKPDSDGKSCGKCGSCVERVEAFIGIGRKDPVEYVDGWDATVAHVKSVLGK